MDKRKEDTLNIFREYLPKLTEADQAYLIGLGDGIAMNLKAAAAQAPAEEKAEAVKAS